MGIYADFPLPEAWQGVLGGLKPVESLPPARLFASLGLLVDACLDLLPPDRASLLWARLGADQTLQEVGDAHGITRERVRQVVKKLTGTFMRDLRLRVVLDGVFAGLGREGALLIDLVGAKSALVPEATPAQLWQFITALWCGVMGRPVQTAHIRDDIYIFAPTGLLAEKDVRQIMTEQSSFLTGAQLAYCLNRIEAELPILACACPKLKRTVNGLYGFQGWTLPILIKAVAEQLGQAGIREWHFSEIGKAVIIFAPHWSGQTPRNFAAVLSRQDVHFFEHAGRDGHWRLKIFGDGYEDNRAAIQAILAKSDIPLHTQDIGERLQRQVHSATIYVLLDREPIFKSFGRGVFGLVDKDYQIFSLEEKAMLAIFEETNQQFFAVADVHLYPQIAHFEIARLILIGRSSASFRYWQWGTHEAQFLTIHEEKKRRFGRWFAHRHGRSLPDMDIIQEGLRQAFQMNDRETVRLTYLHLQEQGVTLSPEMVAWIEWDKG
jgi:Sigma-70, region 4